MDTSAPRTVRIENRKALFDYEIIEEFEAGIALYGPEVKSVRAWQVNLKGSYVTLHSGRPILVGCHISEYRNNAATKIEPKRERLLLLSKQQILRLTQKIHEMWATIVPVEIYSKGNLFKVRIALAKGRKKWEKKQVLKERDLDRETAIKWKF
jgi:SsrA-binding protein